MRKLQFKADFFHVNNIHLQVDAMNHHIAIQHVVFYEGKFPQLKVKVTKKTKVLKKSKN
jgi:hypothetical protein